MWNYAMYPCADVHETREQRDRRLAKGKPKKKKKKSDK